MPLNIYRTDVNPPGWSPDVKEVYIRSGGVWQYVKEIYINQNGNWTSVWQDLAVIGGNQILTIGTTRYHIFTSSGTLQVINGTRSGQVLLIGGGGGGGTSNSSGGGAGGRIVNWSSLSISPSIYTITVGLGGGASAAGSTSSIVRAGTTLYSAPGGNGGASGVRGTGGANNAFIGGVGTQFSRSNNCGNSGTAYLGGGGAGNNGNGTNAIGENSPGQGGAGSTLTPSQIFSTTVHGRGGTSGQDGFAAQGAYTRRNPGRWKSGPSTTNCSAYAGASTFAGVSHGGYGSGGGTPSAPGNAGIVVIQYPLTT